MGSARSDGATRILADYIIGIKGCDLVDLRKKKIGYFDYDFNHSQDEFMSLVTSIIEKYDTIIFATPVYFYAMSAIMKNFFDRLGDLIYKHKELGRRLRGKSMAMISCGAGNYLQEGFQMPFRETARYLGMNYLGDVHGWLEQNEIPEEVKRSLEEFLDQLSSQQKI